MYEAKKIDAEIQKRELEFKIELADRGEKERRELADRAEKVASQRHKLSNAGGTRTKSRVASSSKNQTG